MPTASGVGVVEPNSALERAEVGGERNEAKTFFIKRAFQNLHNAYQRNYDEWAQRHVNLISDASSGAGKLFSSAGKLISLAKTFFSTVRDASDVNDSWWTSSPVMTKFHDISHKSRVVAMALFPFILIGMGLHTKALVSGLKDRKVETIWNASTDLVKDVAALVGTVAQSMLTLISFELAKEPLKVIAKPLIFVSAILSSISIVVKARNLHKRRGFQKLMNESIEKGTFAEFIQQYDAEMLAKHLGVSEGERIQRVVKNAFESGNVKRQGKVVESLKGRVTKNNWSDGLSILADTVSLVSVTILVFAPPLAPIGFALAAATGVFVIAKAAYDYVDMKKFNKHLGLDQDLEMTIGKYNGDLNDGKPDGKGSLKYENGDFYIGSWVEGKIEGKGTYQFQDGRRYEGEWADGKFEGQGKYWYTNGANLEISFEDGSPVGEGTYTYPNGKKFQQVWENGVIQSSELLDG